MQQACHLAVTRRSQPPTGGQVNPPLDTSFCGPCSMPTAPCLSFAQPHSAWRQLSLLRSAGAPLPRLQPCRKRHPTRTAGAMPGAPKTPTGTASAAPAAPVQEPGTLRQALSLLPLPAGSANAEGAFSQVLNPGRLLMTPLLSQRVCRKLEACTTQGAALAAECSCRCLCVKRTPCPCQNCLAYGSTAAGDLGEPLTNPRSPAARQRS